MTTNELTGAIIGAAIEVHKELGPGLLESVYQTCLSIELRQMGFTVETEVPVAITYKGHDIHQEGFRADLIVNDEVVIELKSVEDIKPVHGKQLLTYLRLLDKRIGLLINFNVPALKDGITRVANQLQE